MEAEIIEMDTLNLIGMEFYGLVEEQKEENPMENLWNRFMKFSQEKWNLIQDSVKNPDLSYEVHIWNPQEIDDTGKFHVFIGLEADELDFMPLELVRKKLPSSKYAKFTLKGGEINEWESLIYEDWFKDSEYVLQLFEGYQFHIQRYDEKRFKGIDNLEDSELEVFIPVIKEE